MLALAPGQSPGLQPSTFSPLVQGMAGESFPSAGASVYLLLGPGMTPGLAPEFPDWMSTNYNYFPYPFVAQRLHMKFSVSKPSMAFTVET